MDPSLERQQRWERELEDLRLRLRQVENVDSPNQRRILKTIDGIARDVKTMREQDLNTRLINVVSDVEELRDDARSNRTLIKSSLIAAAFAVAIQPILYAIGRVTGK